MNTKVFFTRHAYSCANYKKDSELTGRITQHLLQDPPLTHWGIIGSQQKSGTYPFVSSSSTQNITVYVSCLIRTWMTAALLYLPNYESVNLIVSPFAKEKDVKIGAINKDNIPFTFYEQCKLFHRFISIYLPNKYITVQLFGNPHTHIILPNTNLDAYPIYNYEAPLPRPKIQTIAHVLGGATTPPPQQDGALYINKLSTELTTKIAALPVPIISTKNVPTTVYGYSFLESDINKFVLWLMTQSPSIQTENTTEYHCVLHSNLMASFLKERLGIEKENNIVSNQNVWTLELSLSTTDNITITDFNVLNGVPKPAKGILIKNEETHCLAASLKKGGRRRQYRKKRTRKN